MTKHFIITIIFVVLLSSCAINSSKSKKFTAFSNQLSIGMDLVEVKKLSKNIVGSQLSKYFMYHQELIDACKNKNCFPSNLHNIVRIKTNGDITVSTPAVGLNRFKVLSLVERIAIFYNKKSKEIIGWVHF